MNESGGAAVQPSMPSAGGQGSLARAGGWLLLGCGVLVIVGYIAEVAMADGETQSWGIFFAPVALTIAALPPLAGVGALRRHRKAQIVGAVIGWLYVGFAALAWLGGTGPDPLDLVVSLPFLFGALFLTLAISRHEV